MTGPQAAAGKGRAEAVRLSFARRQQFEAAHPDVTIVLPGTPTGRWQAVVPLGRAPEGSAGTLGAWDLEELMDQLEEIYQDGDLAPAAARTRRDRRAGAGDPA